MNELRLKEKWAKANGIPTVTDPDTGAISVPTWRGFGCAGFNPGQANSFYVDFNDKVAPGQTHTLATLSKADLGFDEAKRNYLAIDAFIEHPFRNNWYAKAYYTWSKSKGNTEGQTLSDVGQVNVSLTQTWDHREIMEFADGLLPNNRTHQLKVFGYYELTPEWTIGANLLAASGRPLNCIGNYPTPETLGNNDYGSAYRYCKGVPSPRGTAGTLPWDINLDMNLAYRPAALKDLMFKMDVFNVGNRQTLQNQNELYNDGEEVNSRYGRPISYTSPRSVRFSVEYHHKF